MAAHEHLNPDQLRGIAEAHGNKYFANYQDPEKRDRGCCYEYSDHFGTYSGIKGVRSKSWDMDGGGHSMSVVPTTQGPHAVDFTYIQYDKTAKMPIVEHLDEYRARAHRDHEEPNEYPNMYKPEHIDEHIYPSMDWKYGDPL